MSKARFDRKKLLIGTYCLREYARGEEHVRALADAGVDFLCATPADGKLLDLCQRYGIGVFASGVLPAWWGGDGKNAGGLEARAPLSAYEEAAKAFRDHPAIWGLDMGDEPSALDFVHYGRLMGAMKRLFPGLHPYLNLYPNYASVPENTGEECISQLGAATYQEYIDRYAALVPGDYICYDYYMYATTVAGAYENLRVVANKCRETGRDLWIVLQVNSNRPEEWISEGQLRHQAYTAMAFGARSVNWACWTAGWWHNQVLDDRGRPTEQYAKVCAVNRQLRAIGPRYMKYDNVSTHFLGFEPAERLRGVDQEKEASIDAGSFRDVRVEEGFGAIAGYMTQRRGRGEALFLADATEGDRAYYVTLRCPGPAPTALLNGLPAPVLPLGDGAYRVRMEPCSGTLIEWKN